MTLLCETLTWDFCRTLLLDTPVRHSYLTYLTPLTGYSSTTLFLDTSHMTLLLDTSVKHISLTLLIGHSCKTLVLLLETSHVTLLCDTLPWHVWRALWLAWHFSRTLCLTDVALLCDALDTCAGHSYLTLYQDTLIWHFCRTLWLESLVGHAFVRHAASTQIADTDTSAANAMISAALQINHCHRQFSSSANTMITAAPHITHRDTPPANAMITVAPRITHTDTSSANAMITAAMQITVTDTPSANACITAAPRITHADTSSANTMIAAVVTAAPHMTHRDTSCANANITAAPQITHTNTSSANAIITKSTWDTFGTTPNAFAHKEGFAAVTQTVADGCERLRTQTQHLANTALPPDPQSETGTLATHSGKKAFCMPATGMSKTFSQSFQHVAVGFKHIFFGGKTGQTWPWIAFHPCHNVFFNTKMTS